MLHRPKPPTSCVTAALALALLSPGTEAKKSRPANIDEMWKIIEKQQQQIEAARIAAQTTQANRSAATPSIWPTSATRLKW